ncbi:MAG: hypothetical protein QW520_02425 [Methanomassiliicoccales archaeon]
MTSPAEIKQRAAKLEAGLVRSLRLPLERRRMERKLMRLAQEHPKEAVAVLLKFLDHESESVSSSVRGMLFKITAERSGMKAVLDNIVHSNQDVRRNAVAFMAEKFGFHAVTYASFYEHTYLLIAMARNKEIPANDIEALAELSKETYMDGECMKALQDIAVCLDLIKQRHRASDTLRSYVKEILRMAPDLTRMGAFDDRIEEPLRRAIIATKSRMVDETKDIIDIRTLEISIKEELSSLAQTIGSSLRGRPDMEYSNIASGDLFALSRLRNFLETGTALAVSGKREEGLKMLRRYLDNEFEEYWSQVRERVRAGDMSAIFAIYVIGLSCLKLASYLIPQSSEAIFQKYFRKLEPEPSIHVVPWPYPAMRSLT